jgi:hypothetical protein
MLRNGSVMLREAELRRKQEVMKVKALEEEVTESRGAYFELVKSITSSALLSAANVFIGTTAFFAFIFLEIKPITELITALSIKFDPVKFDVKLLLDIGQIALIAATGLVSVRNVLEFFRKTSLDREVKGKVGAKKPTRKVKRIRS